jgi:hypothetical protein
MEIPRSSSSRTMRWAMEKTARPVSRSTSALAARHPGIEHAPAGRCQRSRGGLPLHHATASQAGRSCLIAPALPILDRSKYASAAGVARGAYVLADAPGGVPEVILIGDRERAQHRRRSARATRRRGHPLAGRVNALLGDPRPPDRGIPEQRLAPDGHSSRGCGASIDARLGAIRRDGGAQ